MVYTYSSLGWPPSCGNINTLCHRVPTLLARPVGRSFRSTRMHSSAIMAACSSSSTPSSSANAPEAAVAVAAAVDAEAAKARPAAARCWCWLYRQWWLRGRRFRRADSPGCASAAHIG